MNFAKKYMTFMALAAILSSCSGKQDASESNRLEFEPYSYDAVVALPDSVTTPVEGGAYARYSGSGILPVSIGSNDISALRDSLLSLGGVTILDDSISQPRLPEGFAITEIAPSDTVACSEASNTLTIAMVSPELVVWKNFTYSYLCRAAHGAYKTSFVNYSIPAGKILSLADLFKPGYEKELTALIREKLREQDVDLITPLDEIGIPDDFELTSDGIRFIYGIYEIAPYASGEITVDFDSYELSDLGFKN